MSRWRWILKLQLIGRLLSPKDSSHTISYDNLYNMEVEEQNLNTLLVRRIMFNTLNLLLCTLLSLNPFLHPPLCRKLLEGEETRIGTGITYPGPSMSASAGQGYNYQSRIYTSSSRGSKKEGKDEEQQQQAKSGVKVSQREVYEETVVTTKKTEKQQDASEAPTNQKN